MWGGVCVCVPPPGMLTLPSGSRDRDAAHQFPLQERGRGGSWGGGDVAGDSTGGREQAPPPPPQGLCFTGGSCPPFLTQTVLAPGCKLPPCSQPQRTSQDRVNWESKPLLTPGWLLTPDMRGRSSVQGHLPASRILLQ